MEEILVTGSEGCIGPYLVRELRRQLPQYGVVRVSRRTGPATGGGPRLAVGDLRDPGFVRTLFEGGSIAAVVHAAATPYNVGTGKASPYGVAANDIGALINVLDCCAEVKKFVLLSSALAYESSGAELLAEELTDTLSPPRSAYGFPKYVAEQLVRRFGDQSGVPFTVWRMFNVVSPLEPHAEPGGHVFIDLFRQIFIERAAEVKIFGDGRQERSFIDVGEVAEAVAGNLLNPKTDREVFNLGSSYPISVAALADLLVDIGHELGILPASYSPSAASAGAFAGAESSRRLADLGKLERILEWRAKVGPRDCFTQLIRTKIASL